MAKARQSEAWDHTSLLANILANAHRNQKERPQAYPIHHFHPYKRTQAKSGVSVKQCGTKIFAAFING